MGPKMKPAKGKKGKKGKKEKKPKDDTLTAVDKTFYELTITDLNNKLARLRNHVEKLEETNDEVNERIKQFGEDRTDVTAHLDRQLTEKTNIIKEMDGRILELQTIREAENEANAQIIKNWEGKFTAMHEQLTSEIKLLNGKLSSLEEFRLQRANLLMKFDAQEAEMRELRRAQQEKINDMEQKAIIEKDRLKKDVEVKLLQLSEDFTKSSEIRIAGYTRRLIRENIALHKEMDRMVQSQIRMEDENKKMKNRANEIEDTNSNSVAIKERLIRTCQNQIEIIQNLTTQYEVLRSNYRKIINYKTLYETSLKRDICDTFSYNEMAKKQRILAQRIERLKIDKQRLISLHQQHEMEIIRLQNILKQIKFTVLSAIRAEVDDKDDPEYRAALRKNLLTEMTNILTAYDDIIREPSVSTISERSSIYRPGSLGFIPKLPASLLELFKRKAKKIASAEHYLPVFMTKPFDGKITPEERSLECETLLDVQSGSTLVFSSTSAEEEPPPDDADQEEAGSSSSTPTAKSSGDEVESKKDKKKDKEKEKLEKEKEKHDKVKERHEREKEKLEREKERLEKEKEKKMQWEREKEMEKEVEKQIKEIEEAKAAETEQEITAADVDESEMLGVEEGGIGESDIDAESAALFEAMTEADEEEDEAAYFVY